MNEMGPRSLDPRRATRSGAGRLPLGLPAISALLLLACSGPSAASDAPAEARDRPAPSAWVASATPGEASTIPSHVLDPLIADAADRTGTPVPAIIVIEAQATTWPNGAMGCPEPGNMYTQALVDGWRVILEAGDTRIDYRTSGPGQFRVC